MRTSVFFLALAACTSNPAAISICDDTSGACVCEDGFSGVVCGDWVDDDCDGQDETCPTTAPSSIDIPDWDCTGTPPGNVRAWARFDDGGGYFQDGGCFIFFEGAPDEYYVKRQSLVRASTDDACESRNGCTCPSLNDWPSYDRRLYAFTLHGTPEDCADVVLVDHGGEAQAVSNACRKYLYQLHFYDIEYSYFASGRALFEERLSIFPTVEIACAQDSPHRNLPYQTLLTAPIERP